MGTPLNSIKASDRDVFRNFESVVFKSIDKIVALVVGCADPSGHAFLGSLYCLVDTTGDRAKRPGKIPMMSRFETLSFFRAIFSTKAL